VATERTKTAVKSFFIFGKLVSALKIRKKLNRCEPPKNHGLSVRYQIACHDGFTIF